MVKKVGNSSHIKPSVTIATVSVANQDHSFPKFSDHQIYHEIVAMQPRDKG